MKSTKDKKKNLTKDLGSVKNIKTNEFKLPKGYSAACHLHKEPLLFITLDAMTRHMNNEHRIFKS